MRRRRGHLRQRLCHGPHRGCPRPPPPESALGPVPASRCVAPGGPPPPCPCPPCPACLSGPHSPPHVLGVGLAWLSCLSDVLATPQTSAQTHAGSMPCACPVEAVPAAPVTASPVTGPTDLCAPTTGTRMTMTAGASRPSVSTSVPSLLSTRARAVSTGGRSMPGAGWAVLRQALLASSHIMSIPSHARPGVAPGGQAGLSVVRGSGRGILSGGHWEHQGTPVEAESPSGFEGQWGAGLCVLPTSSSVRRSVRLSGLSALSVLPSLSAPPLVSSSLTYWQDEAPHLPPGARSPRSAPRHGRGGGSLLPGLVVLRASGQTPPPPRGPGCGSGLQTLPMHACIWVPGLLVVRAQWPGQAWPWHTPLWAVRKPPSWGQPPTHTRAGGWGHVGLCPCACLSCVCPFLCCILCVWPFWSTLRLPSPPWERVCCVELGLCA